MTARLWFNVPLCDDCWHRVEPTREPHAHRLLENPAGECCVHCGAELEQPIYVRTCWPPAGGVS